MEEVTTHEAIARMIETAKEHSFLLKREIAERDALLRKILDEVNADYAHGGPSRLNEATIAEIEKVLGI